MTNYLDKETSPYLLQHVDNAVDWHPWGEKALGLAKKENKPILLSIGYAACHWCHVMAHESFEDEETARLTNEHFINIKVDREERPDLGQYLYECRHRHDRTRRMADDRISDPGRPTVLQRHLFPQGATPRHAEL